MLMLAQLTRSYGQTWLLWKIYSGLNYLLTNNGGSPDEPPRVMTLFDVIRTIKLIQADDRIEGIIADFSATHLPAVPSYDLGLAQIEEIQGALVELRKTKQEKLGVDGWRTIAWTDTFQSQGQYLLATCFDEVYTQPTGDVPLVGMAGSTVPFYGRLAKWLGIEVHAEARNEYKSFVQPYIDEKFTKPQKANQEELITDLNDNLLTYIAHNRFPEEVGTAGLEKVKALSRKGPFTSSQAVTEGLLDGAAYRQDVLDSVMTDEEGRDKGKEVKGFYHYAKIMERALQKSKAAMDVGVVYLLGTIGDQGEFGTSAVVRGLKEAGEDDSIGAIILRIDSGGGGVVESDTIWGAVREARERYGKVVVASFANASASGGYLVSTHTDAIFAAPSTVTGSIGVASLRPTFLTSFFDRFHLTIDSFFTGSRSSDPTHKLSGEELTRHSAHVDEMYSDFKNRVCEGRGIHPEVIELIAGGRVMTGLKAFSLTAPKELVEKLEGQGLMDHKALEGLQDKAEKAVPEAKEEVVAEKVVAGDKKVEAMPEGVEVPDLVAIVDKDQETSPYAPAVIAEQADVVPAAAVTADVVSESQDGADASSPESNAMAALASATEAELVDPVEEEKKSTAWGRGLVDGLAGIWDSATYAHALYISNAVAEYREENPGVTAEEATQQLLPNATFQHGPGGELLLNADIRLRRYPLQKSFWQQFVEMSRRGDSIDSVALGDFLKAHAAQWVMRMAAGMVASEMEDLGLGGWGDARSGLGLGKAGRAKMTNHAEIIHRCKKLIPPLTSALHKGQAGRIGVVGGSKDYSGAPFFSSMATLRLGADLAHVICEPSAGNVIKTYSPDLIVHTDLHEDATEESLTELFKGLLPRLHVLIIGPGLGRSDGMQLAARVALKLAREEEKYVVIDADGLWLVQNDPSVVKGYKRAVLTPNPVEFQRLCDAVDINTENVDQAELAAKLAKELGGLTILEKGGEDKVTNGEETFFNSVEGSNRRCGGQGDVLSGAVGCFLAWGKSYEEREGNDTDLTPSQIPLLAAYAGSTVTRHASKLTFARMQRAMQTSDMLNDVGPSFQQTFGALEEGKQEEASLRWPGKRRMSKSGL
ncbi:protease IV [Pseudohyphozyma bogoriensis]|nr:protease IV [Pseudohyphozyma bogoriensis]